MISLSSSGLIIGTHIPFSKSLSKTITLAISSGMYSFQFFLGNPQSFVRTTLSDDDIKTSLSLMDRYPLHIFTHSPYVYNIANEDVNPLVVKSLENELGQVSSFQGNGVVLHPGSNKDKKKGIEEIAKNISKIKFTRSKLILENMAGQGNMIGSTLQELRDIRDNVVEDKRPFIGYCIDTAHIWGTGLYDLSKKEGVDKMFSDIKNILGIENVCLFHINDSKAKFGSNLDRHELLCNGEIWSKDKGESLRYLLNIINSYNIPIVLETDPSDIIKFLY